MIAPVAPITPPDTLAIGEINQTVFDCPKCSRPLAVGAKRCPGCGTRLALGIPLAKVAVFASSGVAIGLLVGIGIGFAVGLVRPAAPAVIAQTPVASTAPIASAQTGGTANTGTNTGNTDGAGSGGTAVLEMPALTRSALTQALAVDMRLTAGAASLRAAQSATTFNASEVAKILRALAADAVIGRQLADHVTAWSGSATVGTDLDKVYDSVHSTATEALVNSVRYEAAYRSAATEMLKVLAGLTPADGAARALAGQAGIELPSTTP